MISQLLTVEYSPRQRTYHVDFLEDTLQKNRDSLDHNRPVDWVILHVTDSWDEAKEFIRKREGDSIGPNFTA